MIIAGWQDESYLCYARLKILLFVSRQDGITLIKKEKR